MKKKTKLLTVLILAMLIITGCTTQLKDNDNKVVTNPKTGQALTENILCRPTDSNEEIINLYIENGVNLEELPLCKEFTPFKGDYEGVWTSIVVKPLAWLVLSIGNLLKNTALGLIFASILIRLAMYPVTKKTALQSEAMNKAKPEIDKLEKKYKDKKDNESIMKKSQEMSLIYKKYNINPISGCLLAVLQIPLLFGFLEAINRVPAIFETTFLGIHFGTTPLSAITSGSYFYIVLTVIVALSTYYSMKHNQAAANNEQAKSMNKVMFYMITVMSIFMTSALNIYWISTNVFTIGQNYLVKRKKV